VMLDRLLVRLHKQKNRLVAGAGAAGDPAAYQRFGKRHPGSGDQAQNLRRHDERGRPPDARHPARIAWRSSSISATASVSKAPDPSRPSPISCEPPPQSPDRPRICPSYLNPGLIKSNIRAAVLGDRTILQTIMEAFIGLTFPSAETYAARIAPLLVADELEDHSGVMFNSRGEAIEASRAVKDPAFVTRVINATEELANRALGSRVTPGEGRGLS
jgi:hypothetical protein